MARIIVIAALMLLSAKAQSSTHWKLQIQLPDHEEKNYFVPQEVLRFTLPNVQGWDCLVDKEMTLNGCYSRSIVCAKGEDSFDVPVTCSSSEKVSSGMLSFTQKKLNHIISLRCELRSKEK
ncbi:hypothetical protein BH10BDE1_BH10BDE1_23460 [soil metagenome]